MPNKLDALAWPGAAVKEARRVAADPASITLEVEEALGEIARREGAAQDMAWVTIDGLVDSGVASHLRDLWLYAVVGAAYDPQADDHASPNNVMLATRGVPPDHRPVLRTIAIAQIPEAPDLCRAWAVWVDQGESVLIGPFFTARSLLAAVRVRTQALRRKFRQLAVRPL
jgi:hypothetical protein